MKKITYLVLPFLLLSCSKDVCSVSVDSDLTDEVTTNYSDVLTRAEQIAYSLADSEDFTISEDDAMQMVDDYITHLNSTQTRSSSLILKKTHIKNGVADFYEFQSGDGYAIVSADKRIPEVMCVTDRGSLADTTTNLGLQIFVNGMRHYMEEQKKELANIDSLKLVAEAKLSTISTKAVPSVGDDEWTYQGRFTRNSDVILIEKPILTTWGQQSPYNNLLPYISGTTQSAYAGCGVTATAQVMAYNKKYYEPRGITETIWNDIIDNNNNSMLQLLFLDLFSSMAKEYTLSGTTVNTDKIEDFLEDNSYTVGGYVAYDFDTAVAALGYGPTIMTGNNTTTGEGHGWCVDGVNEYNTYIYDLYTMVYNGTTLTDEQVAYQYTYKKLKINWGGNGENDGWFTSGAFRDYNALNYIFEKIY